MVLHVSTPPTTALPSYVDDTAVHPRHDSPDYRSTALRHPENTLHLLPQRLTEITGPLFGHDRVRPGDDNLTSWDGGEATGQRIVVHGRVLDSDGRSVPDTLLEIWQANAAGRYRHVDDQWSAPLDPHFAGLGRCATDPDGRFSFTTIRPGAYPWGNHGNAWRPAHIHLSLFGRAFTQRLVTQMYFPGDPLFPLDPIVQSILEPAARGRLIARYDHDLTQPEYATGYRWDIVVCGSRPTWTDDG
jgi:protocatechuate 3,4-dioxygenase beta subunit